MHRVLVASPSRTLRCRLVDAAEAQQLPIEVAAVGDADALLRALALADGASGIPCVLVDDTDRSFQAATARIWSLWPRVAVVSCAPASIALSVSERNRGPRAIAARRAAFAATMRELRDVVAALPA